jgi:hypothetical protein
MNESNDKLTHKQLTALAALLSKHTVTQAAAEAGVSRTTIYTWLRQPDFTQELRKAQNAAIEAAASRLAGGLSEAIEELARLIKSADTDSVKRLACSDWISFSLRLREFSDLEQRIEALEARA